MSIVDTLVYKSVINRWLEIRNNANKGDKESIEFVKNYLMIRGCE